MKVALGSDHAGFELKEAAKEVLEEMGFEYDDLGVHSYKRVDYVPYGKEVALGVANGKYDRGILFCGSGIGMSIVANKIAGIRAALCHEPYTARLSREHNDANVLVLAGRTTAPGIAAEIIRVWLTTPFAGGRHQKRLDQIKELEYIPKSTSYYVYENWTAEKKAVIHRGSCSFCKNGKGVHQNIHGERHGRWHRPFYDYNKARSFAHSLKNRTVRECSFCKPWKN